MHDMKPSFALQFLNGLSAVISKPPADVVWYAIRGSAVENFRNHCRQCAQRLRRKLCSRKIMTSTTEAALTALAGQAPAFSVSDAARIARDLYGVDGQLRALEGERDQNFHISSETGGLVLKIIDPTEDPDVVDLQIRALLHIADVDPGLPVPRIVMTRAGESRAIVKGHVVHALSFLDGELLEGMPAGADLLSDIGRMTARMGLALRGLRPITEIQYLDYLLFALEPLSDDVCTTHYRTKGQQSVPLIVRTRGHRLEGIWHSGSPMGMIINSLRGMYVCVPRNMTQAVGMYNTLLMSNDPAIIIECLNGYRLKEKLPVNLLDYRVPLGIPEVIKEGTDITIVSYGSVLRIILEAAKKLDKIGISCEVIDVQTLLPFDRHHKILESLKKTNRILFVDEDVPGGASAFMFNHVMEIQGGYRWLDVSPRTLTAKAHRPAYGSDGDYFSKPNEEDVISKAKEMMAE